MFWCILVQMSHGISSNERYLIKIRGVFWYIQKRVLYTSMKFKCLSWVGTVKLFCYVTFIYSVHDVVVTNYVWQWIMAMMVGFMFGIWFVDDHSKKITCYLFAIVICFICVVQTIHLSELHITWNMTRRITANHMTVS